MRAKTAEKLETEWNEYVAEYWNPVRWKYRHREIWKPVPAVVTEGYEASSWGRLRKLSTGALVRPQRQLFKANGAQYAQVHLGQGPCNPLVVGVHRMVAFAFHGVPPAGKNLACHYDDNRLNNQPGNLHWGDHNDNRLDYLFTTKYAHLVQAEPKRRRLRKPTWANLQRRLTKIQRAVTSRPRTKGVG